MTVIYVVMRQGFEYNYESHSDSGIKGHLGEVGGGEAVEAFTSRIAARDKVEEYTLEFLKGWGQNLGQFGYEMAAIFNSRPSFSKMSDDEFFDDSQPGDVCMASLGHLPKLTDDQLKEIAGCLEFAPYYVDQVQLNG